MFILWGIARGTSRRSTTECDDDADDDADDDDDDDDDAAHSCMCLTDPLTCITEGVVDRR